uniref:Mucin-15 n=1 Tax=Electrophorus electricus TaxID=8005 RepID=A0A4W4H7D5_ELEEL
MKLGLGFAFAILLTLHSLQLVSAQIPNSWKRILATNSPEEMFSGDDEYPNSNQTLEESRQDLLLTTPTSLNSSSELLEMPDNTNKTLIQEDIPVVPTPHLISLMTNEMSVNHTNTMQPGSLPSNNTANDTFEATQNPTSTGDKGSMAPVTNTTITPFEGTANGTSSRMTTMSPTTNMTTGKLPETVRPETTAMYSTNSNRTWGSFDVKGGTDRGVSSDIQKNTNNHAWGAILGIGIAVGITALAVYVITKWRNHRDFSHRKLVEDTRCDPVLRLDNSEPLDLKFDGCAYYNPGLQGDNIQMTNFPQGHYK